MKLCAEAVSIPTSTVSVYVTTYHGYTPFTLNQNLSAFFFILFFLSTAAW